MAVIPTTMLAVRHHGEDDLRLETVPTPEPATGDVLVAVRAAGYTPTELTWAPTLADRTGRPRMAIPGHELSGVVVAHGPGTARFAVGDEVFGLSDWYRDGALADYIAVEARNLALKPATLDHVSAAALSLAGPTAWQALFDHGRLKAGERVLVTGAAGGVGALAVQLAVAAGAHVIALDRPRRRAELLALGAHEVVEAPVPADLVVDFIGGATGSRLVSIIEPVDGGIFFIVEPDAAQLAALAERDLRATAGATAPLSGALEAIASKERHEISGKLVITPS